MLQGCLWCTLCDHVVLSTHLLHSVTPLPPQSPLQTASEFCWCSLNSSSYSTNSRLCPGNSSRCNSSSSQGWSHSCNQAATCRMHNQNFCDSSPAAGSPDKGKGLLCTSLLCCRS